MDPQLDFDLLQKDAFDMAWVVRFSVDFLFLTSFLLKDKFPAEQKLCALCKQPGGRSKVSASKRPVAPMSSNKTEASNSATLAVSTEAEKDEDADDDW